jgi:hypothetical protein
MVPPTMIAKLTYLENPILKCSNVIVRAVGLKIRVAVLRLRAALLVEGVTNLAPWQVPIQLKCDCSAATFHAR